MTAIPMHCFQELSTALGRCKIASPEAGNSWILDRNDEKIGAINWDVPSVTIFESYEYSDEVVEAIGEQKFIDVSKDFDHDSDDYDASEGVPEDAITDILIPDSK